MASSDTIVVNGVPSGSFVINRDSAVANKEIIDAMYKNKKKMKKYNYGGQTNPMNESIVVGDGEALMDNSMVNQYGLGFMQMLNQKPTAHESIDGLIASAQLSNMQNFKGGGYVSGAGNMMRETGMPTMGYKRGGYVPKMGNMMRESNMPTMGYNDGGYVNEYEDGGSVDPRDSVTNTGINQGMISPFFGDTLPVPPAWMQPATEMVQTPEEAAAFQDMINKLMVEEALKQARANGEQVEPVEIKIPEDYPLETIDKKMQNRIQFPVVQEKNPMSNLGRSWIDR